MAGQKPDDIELLRQLVGIDKEDESEDVLLEIFYEMAADEVINYANAVTDAQREVVLTKYSSNIYKAYIEIYNKQGAEGQLTHDENGIKRTYQQGWLSDSCFSGITPYVQTL